MKAVGEGKKALEEWGTPQWLSYIRYDVPWYLNDQDCLMRYQLIREGRTLVYFRSRLPIAASPLKMG